MTPIQLQTAGRRLFGHKHWKTRLAEALGVDSSTMRRMMYRERVPGPYEIAINALLAAQREREKIEVEARKLIPRKLRKRKRAYVPRPSYQANRARRQESGGDRPDEAAEPPTAPAGDDPPAS